MDSSVTQIFPILFHILYELRLRYKSFAKVIYKLFRSEVLTVTGSTRSVPWFFELFSSALNIYVYIYAHLYILNMRVYNM